MWVLFVPVANKIIGLENPITIHLDYIVLIAYYITVKSSVVDPDPAKSKRAYKLNCEFWSVCMYYWTVVLNR